MEKLLITSNFSFSHSVFKKPVQQTRKNQALFGKGLIVWSLTIFSTLFQLYFNSHVFQFFLPLLCTIFFPSHWCLSHITIVETMDNSARGINPVTLTITYSRREHRAIQGSNQRIPVLHSCTLTTELHEFSEDMKEY